MTEVFTEKRLGWSILLVVFLWLSPTFFNFYISIGNQQYSWGYLVLFVLLPIFGICYIILAFLKRQWWLILLGLACLFSFFISMLIGYIFLGP